VNGRRPIVFGGPLLDAIRTGAPIPTGAELHILANGDVDAAALVDELDGMTVGGAIPVVIDVNAPAAPEWEQSHNADAFAYESALLTTINGLDDHHRPTVVLDPIFITSEIAAITSALAQVDDLIFQGTSGQRAHDAHGRDVIELRRIDADRTAWYAQAIILLADADHELVHRELDSLAHHELEFVRSLIETHCAAPELDDIVQSLRNVDLYDHAIDAREHAREFLAAIDERMELLAPYEATLSARTKRFFGLGTATTVADLDLTSTPEIVSADLEPGMATIYDNFMELRAERLAREGVAPEPTR
jgi:hypothetical protein